jgi:hypothetical protein
LVMVAGFGSNTSGNIGVDFNCDCCFMA